MVILGIVNIKDNSIQQYVTYLFIALKSPQSILIMTINVDHITDLVFTPRSLGIIMWVYAIFNPLIEHVGLRL